MSYSVKELFYTLQGEGTQQGRSAVFCRFAGCNLWSGLEKDRSDAFCNFCDTDFVGVDGPGGGKFGYAHDLADRIHSCWIEGSGSSENEKFVVFTGGEPALQLDESLIRRVKELGFFTAIETNGTVELKSSVDWVCVSPKAGVALKVSEGNELKVVFPQTGLDLYALSKLDFAHFLLQPKDSKDYEKNLALTVAFCKKNPIWRVSLQTHKVIGIP